MATTVTLKPNAIDISGSTSGTTTVQATAVAGTTVLTLPAATDTLVGKATTDTLTNKTLTSPTINGATIATGTINNTTIGATTPTTGAFTSITASTTITATGAGSIQGLTVGQGGGAGATNTALGSSALAANSTGTFNVAAGFNSLTANTSGQRNTSVGYASMVTSTTASFNTGIGFGTLNTNTGSNNTAVGEFALGSNLSGASNTAIGRQALFSNTTASNSTAVGHEAGFTNSTSAANAFFGYQAGYNSTGQVNTFVGYQSGNGVTTGSKNVIIGSYTGSAAPISATGSNYIVLSDGDGNVRQTIDSSGNVLVGKTSAAAFTTQGIEVSPGSTSANLAVTSTSATNYDMVRLTRTGAIGIMVGFFNGSSRVGDISIGASSTAYNTSSDYRLKNTIAPMTGALAKVALLKPCTYKWKVDGSDGQGFIAHELDEVVSGCVTGEKDAVDAEGNPQYQGIDTSFLVATLTAAIQEQQALITSLTARIAALESK